MSRTPCHLTERYVSVKSYLSLLLFNRAKRERETEREM